MTKPAKDFIAKAHKLLEILFRNKYVTHRKTHRRTIGINYNQHLSLKGTVK